MLRTLVDRVLGTPFALPTTLLAAYPELARVQWRRGGWCLGRATVSGITVWRTVCLAPGAALEPGLLLHELRHVDQFESDPAFPLRYLFASVRYGYRQNPYEVDARAFAARRLAGAPPTA
jgi:hypothetical protein